MPKTIDFLHSQIRWNRKIYCLKPLFSVTNQSDCTINECWFKVVEIDNDKQLSKVRLTTTIKIQSIVVPLWQGKEVVCLLSRRKDKF